MRIVGGRVLRPDGFGAGELCIDDGVIAEAAGGPVVDARGLLVLPGIVDLHGDGFERSIQPRPGVAFPIRLAVADTAAQLLANGITTAFLGVTLSWEPGLRSVETWSALLDALDGVRTACDMRVHLRWEAFNSPAPSSALAVALRDIAAGRVGMVAFNDHTPSILARLDDPAAAAKYSERAGVSAAAFRALALAVGADEAAVGPARDAIAAAARAAGLPMASHDDASVAIRDGFRALGARVCEFPMAEAVGRAAVAAGDWVAMGSPNVVRGGSHLGWSSAAAMAEAGVCRVLTSDYYYPAMAQAPFVLAARGVMELAEAWALVSAGPAAAAGLVDRGVLAMGRRGDVVLVAEGEPARVVLTIVAGRVAGGAAEGFARVG